MSKLPTFIIYLVLGLLSPQISQAQKEPNLFLITTDGLRWQELFQGVDSTLVYSKDFTRRPNEMWERFGATTPQDRREKLFPFLWSIFAGQGQLLGNRKMGSEVQLRNMHGFSYPGYNEMLTGNPDPDINSNDKFYNPHTTFLEKINRDPAFQGKVAAFGTWDVFPFIINSPRSGVPVNAGQMTAVHPNDKEALLNDIQRILPSQGSSRRDFLTYFFAKEYIKKNKPKVVLISFDETDEFAHQGNYDAYIEAAHTFDAFVQDLWNYCQQDSMYVGNTYFLLTTDHGRGDQVKSQWTSHGRIIRDCFELWMGALGPGILPLGEVKNTERVFLYQMAPSALHLLGQKPEGSVVPTWKK